MAYSDRMTYSTASRSNPAIGISNESGPDSEWSPDLDPDDLRELQAAQNDPSKVVARLPKESARLGYFSCLCLISNRLIGSGVFTSASVIFPNTQSIGLALILSVIGGIFSIAGIIVYIELGLTIPRWPFGPNGEKVSTPRSGDALNYLNYMLKKPMFLATCLFGICFIVLENSSHNAIAFAQNILDASFTQATPGKIIAIAFSVNTFCCLLHAISRRWGIIVNNVFGTVKFLILVFVIIIGLIWINRDVASSNFDVSTSFSTTNSSRSPYRFAEAFLWVIFPYGTFHQLNYVISEVDQPRKTFPRASFYGVLIAAIMLGGVNFIYAAVIPKKELFTPGGIDVGLRFIQLTLGHTGLNNNQLQTFWTTLKAITVLGNLIVTTFTAARVKQEIAKEGVLPYSLFFAQSYDLSLRRLFGQKSPKVNVNSLYSENTPAATLALHWMFANIMVLISVLAVQPQPYSSTPAYTFLVCIVVYVTNLIKFSLIAIGLLCLRLSPKVRWSEKSQFNHPVVSITAALVLLTICVFPLICIWIPDPAFKTLSRTAGLVSWFVIQTVGLGLVGVAFLYWLLFRSYILVQSAREGKTLQVKREPKFKVDSGGLTQIVEIVTLQWVREVGIRIDEIEETSRAQQGLSPEHSRQLRTSGYSINQRSISEAETRHDSYYYAKVPHELPGQVNVSELDVNQSYAFNRSPEQPHHELD